MLSLVFPFLWYDHHDYRPGLGETSECFSPDLEGGRPARKCGKPSTIRGTNQAGATLRDLRFGVDGGGGGGGQGQQAK